VLGHLDVENYNFFLVSGLREHIEENFGVLKGSIYVY
jgi:hypothetical protein